jgi:hypothetical protein
LLEALPEAPPTGERVARRPRRATKKATTAEPAVDATPSE